jgi:hypothetical protein
VSEPVEGTPHESAENPAPANGDGDGFWRGLLRRAPDPPKDGAPRSKIAARRPARSGNTIPLVALAPKYHREYHQVYLDLLERALLDPETYSIALTGSYGSGKSSVLRALRGRRWARWWNEWRVVELSLSTLDPDLTPPVPAENPAEQEMSNRIQKELVKQLLYRLPPGRTPRSRFPRASTPSLPTGVLVALSAAAAVGLAWVVTTFAGWHATIAQRLDGAGWSPPWFWGGVTIGLALLSLAAWWRLSGRYALQAGLKAGALTVSLEPSSSSYFDQYLDEIMYFFQTSKTNVVLIEDVDRFGDAVVFDTLRALNILVNGSGQVGRRVVFVYAIRDSVLGQIGKKKKTSDEPGDADPAAKSPTPEIDRANRAKYFDVIIPIVPFVTTDNARDLMMRVMSPHVADAPGKNGISPALIRLAARYVADMRTLWSIRNEFEIHLDRLMKSARHVMPEINEDIVLSLVLLRATSPDAYEKIRLATSPLDTIVKRWLELVDANLDSNTRKLTDLRTQLENGVSRESRAERAGQQLDALRPELLSMAKQATAAEEVDFSGPLTDANLGDPGGWQKIASGTQLTVTLRSEDVYGRVKAEQTRLGSQMLARLIGMPIDPQAWQEADLEELRDKIDVVEDAIPFLRHHTWQQLYARTGFTVTAEPGEIALEPGEKAAEGAQINFEGLVRRYAPTPLAQDLIAHGYLPRHFARYSSMFYGDVVGLNATEYISRAIEPGIPIPEYELDEQAIGEILTEQDATNDDADLLDDLSVYNLDLVTYLIKHRRGAAQRVATHLAERWNDPEQTFVSRFFQREDQDAATALAELMTPTWDRGLRYTAVDAQLTPENRLGLVNAVLGAMSTDERDDLDADVGRYLSDNYAALASLTDPPDEVRAALVIAAIGRAGGTIHDLTKLKPTALIAAAQASVYPVTATNLQALGGTDRVALDALNAEPTTRPIYDHALRNLNLYLDALTQFDPPGTPVQNPADFAAVLNDVATTRNETLLDRFVRATSPGCRIPDLNETETDPETWPALVKHRRTDSTFRNVQSYVDGHSLDQTLGEFLTEHGNVATRETTPQSERIALATAILSSRETIPTSATRVALAVSIAPGAIPITHIASEDAGLVGPLLAAHLLGDDPETFDPDLLARWEDLETAISASQEFGNFADPTTMPPRYLARTLKSKNIPDTAKAALVTRLGELLPGATQDDATNITESLAELREHLDLPRIEALSAAGASVPSLVHLLSAQGESLPVSDLRAVLLGMGGDYARVSTGRSGGRGGRDVVRFPVDQSHRILLARLADVTHTGAKERPTVRHGRNLEANLKTPAA